MWCGPSYFFLLTDTLVCATMLIQKLLYYYATTCQKLCQLEKFRERLQEVFIAVDFGRKLKDMRAAEQLTQHELGQQIGVSTAAIQSWERNLRAPGMEHLVRLSRAFHTSIDDMLGLEFNKNQDTLSGSERMFLSRYRMLDEYGQRAVQSICDIEHERTTAAQTHKTSSNVIDFDKELGKRIPYFSLPSAAGFSSPLDDDNFTMITVKGYVPTETDFAINIQGNSMFPYIHDGDMVFVKKQEELNVGDVGIFCVDGAMYCKQYYRAEDGTVMLVSANPALEDTNIVLAPDCGRSVSVCGRVLLGKRVELPRYLFK